MRRQAPGPRGPRPILHYAGMIYAFAPFTTFAPVTATIHESVRGEALAMYTYILMACALVLTESTMIIRETGGGGGGNYQAAPAISR